MKYNIGEKVKINETEWVISEYRMRGGIEWIYTLSREDDLNVTMSLNEGAVESIVSTNLVGSKNEI